MAEAGREHSGFFDDDAVDAADFRVKPLSADRPVSRRSRSRRRMVFFALASAWGFFSGTSAVLVALMLLGRPVFLGSRLALTLAVAAVAAVAGGLVVAAAYRENSRR